MHQQGELLVCKMLSDSLKKASKHFQLLNVTVSYSLSVTYVLAMYLFVYSSSSDHCCFRVFHISRTFQACCTDTIHSQQAIAEKLEEEEKNREVLLNHKCMKSVFQSSTFKNTSSLPLCLHPHGNAMLLQAILQPLFEISFISVCKIL